MAGERGPVAGDAAVEPCQGCVRAKKAGGDGGGDKVRRAGSDGRCRRHPGLGPGFKGAEG